MTGLLLLALLIGIVAGLRAMTAPAAVAWALHLGWIAPAVGWTAFMGWRFTPWIFLLLALAELVSDQLPATPSRKIPIAFGTRLIVGALCGATIGVPSGALATGVALGIVGAALGTYGGAAARGALAKSFGRDRPAALIEDVVAIGGALAALCVLG